VVSLSLNHPSLPWHAWMRRAMPEGLEVFTAMLAGTAVALAFATRERTRAARAAFDGMGWAFAHIITIIAVSAGTAKALEVAGVLGAFVDLAGQNPAAALAVAFALAFVLAVVSGSGTASSVALISAIGPRAAELGVAPLALGGVILVGAEAGRTTSPVAAVLLFGSNLVTVPPKSLAFRLALPCLLGAAAGALVCAATG
jgi:C4-dicarboxylate transporter, DcuC family